MKNSLQKTVQFWIKTFWTEKESKNKYYSDAVKYFKENKVFNEKIQTLLNRSIFSMEESEWDNFTNEVKSNIEEIKKYIENYKDFFEKIEKIPEKEAYQVQINIGRLKSIWSFWKWIFYSIKKIQENQEKKQKEDKKNNDINKIDLWKFNKKIDTNTLKEQNTLKRYFNEQNEKYWECKSPYDFFKIFLEERIEKIYLDLTKVISFLEEENHSKEKYSELYKKIFYIIKNIDTLKLYINDKTISFSWNLHEIVSNVKNEIIKIKGQNNVIENILVNLDNNFRSPWNGYEIWKSTIHYKTLYKKSEYESNISNYKKVIWDKISNKLSKDALKILKKFFEENTKKENFLNDLKNKDSIISKSELLLKIVKDITKKEDICLHDIINAINNKNQNYHDFIMNRLSFEDIWLKQRLRFALTVLVDCEIYKPKKYINRCNEIKKEAEVILKDFGFYEKYKSDKKDTIYDEYKKLTSLIHKNNINKNIKTIAKERWNLYVKSNIYKNIITLNKELSTIISGLNQHLQKNENENLNIDKIQFFTVLWQKDWKNIAIFIKKENTKELYKFINDNKNQHWNDSIYIYDSITTKTLKKLFDQAYSSEHPFKNIKEELASKRYKEKQKEYNIDDLKFKDLKNNEIVEILSSKKDIPWNENWEEKYKNVYSKLNLNKIENIVDNYWLRFEKKQFNIEELKNKFPNIIIVNIENWIRNNITKNHINYFERAFKEMLNKEGNPKIRLNPEIQILYTPEAFKELKREKIEERKWKVSEDILKNTHRYWRESIKLWFPIEFNINEESKDFENNFNIIALDRWERKIATLCHLEYRNGDIHILPIKYYDNDKKTESYTYFIDCANYKVSKLNNKKVIIKFQNTDNNLNMKKYELLVRLQKTLWLENKQKELKNIFSNEELININGKEIINKLKEKIDFDKYWLGTYIDKENFFDEKLNNNIKNIITNWKNFNEKEIPQDKEKRKEWYYKKMLVEVDSIKLRQNISSQITGIVDFLYGKNLKDNISSYVILENLHNSSWSNIISTDRVSWQKLINEDFVEATHNKLAQTGLYHKIEQGIINKLQIHFNWDKYQNLSISSNKNYYSKLNSNLKKNSKNKRDFKDSYKIEFSWKYKLSEIYLINKVWFIDPFYTSNKCPKCWIDNRNKTKHITGHTTDSDIIKCSICNFTSKSPKTKNEKINFKNIYNIVWTWDENWSLQIWLRWIQELIYKNPKTTNETK